MSPVSNKFEGIPQQQRYQTETVWMLKPLLCEIVFVFSNIVISLHQIFFLALLQATQSLHLVQGFFPNYLKKVQTFGYFVFLVQGVELKRY